MEWRGVRIALVIVPIILLSFSIIIPENTSAETIKYGDPVISIGLRQSRMNDIVRPEYYRDGSVCITGTVFAQIPWCPDIKYLLCQVEIDAGDWAVNFMKPLTFSRAQKQQSFTSVITIPWNTLARTNKTIDFYCRWSYETNQEGYRPNGRVGPFSTTVRVPQFYYLDLSAPNYLEIKHGEKDGVNLVVMNKGTGSDRPRIEISNLKELSEKGINIQCSQYGISHPLKSKNFSMSIGIEKWTPSGFHMIEVKVISAQAEGLGEVQQFGYENILIKVKGPLNPYVIYPVSIISGVIILTILSTVIIEAVDWRLRTRVRRSLKAEE